MEQYSLRNWRCFFWRKTRGYCKFFARQSKTYISIWLPKVLSSSAGKYIKSKSFDKEKDRVFETFLLLVSPFPSQDHSEREAKQSFLILICSDGLRLWQNFLSRHRKKGSPGWGTLLLLRFCLPDVVQRLARMERGGTLPKILIILIWDFFYRLRQMCLSWKAVFTSVHPHLVMLSSLNFGLALWTEVEHLQSSADCSSKKCRGSIRLT